MHGYSESEGLTHIDERGNARMVDVSAKPETRREAVAIGRIAMRRETLGRLLAGDLPKGDAFAVARVAGIMAAKSTSSLIPLCHPIPIDSVAVELSPGCSGDVGFVEIEARVTSVGRTGVEMEALTAVCGAALAIYDMAKAIDKGMTIQGIRLMRKSGGRSGDFIAEEER